MTDVLGNTGKSASPGAQDVRIERYRLQSEARRLVSPKDALQGCLRWPVGGGNGRVAVKYRRKAQYAFYGGLQTCGQIWKCPVCAAKITERRRKLWEHALNSKVITTTQYEDGAVAKLISHGWSLAMATFTLEHHFGEELQSVIGRLERAYQLMWSGKWAVKFKASGSIVGTVRAMEVTHGMNGWHPHIHCLFIMEGAGMRYQHASARSDLQERWHRVVGKAGGSNVRSLGCVFTVADIRSIEYIDKMGIETVYRKLDKGQISETTKYPTKKGRGDNVGLFGLLALSAGGGAEAGSLWQQAQVSLKHRKHIATSQGLLRRLGASIELSDNNLAATEIDDYGDELLAILERAEWDVIDRRELRAQLLNIAQSGNAQTVQDFLVEVGAR